MIQPATDNDKKAARIKYNHLP